MRNYFNGNIKEEIKRVNPDTLVNRGYAQAAENFGIVCPHCGNGSGEDGTGIEFKQDANGFYRAHCFKCGENFDNLRVIADHFGYNLRQDFPKVLAEGATLLGASAGFDFKHHHKTSAKNFSAKNQQDKKAQEKPPVDHSQFIQVAKNNLINLPFATYRGLMAETLVHFNFGYAVNWKHPDIKNAPPSDRIIIPTSKFHYLARAIDDSVPEQFRKQHVGHKEIFNVRDLKPNATVVVMEGELDVASVWQVTDGLVPAIAVSGCSNYKLLLKWLENNPDCNCSFIVIFDNDSKEGNAGQTNAKKFVAELIKRGFPAVNKLLSDRKDFDANDWLEEDSDTLKQKIFQLYDESATELEIIADDIQEEKDFQAKVDAFENSNGKIPTGVIDEIKATIETLYSFDVDNFDARLISDESFRRKLGLCSFYNFANFALDNFMAVFIAKRKLSLQKVKLGVELKDTEKPFLSLSESDVKKIIKNAAKLVAAQHEEFNREQKRQQREQYRQQKQAEYEQFFANGVEKLEYLHTLPQTDERDEKIRSLILELCDYQQDRYGYNIAIKTSVRNFRLIFNYDPAIVGLLRYDAFSGTIVFAKEPFWRDPVNDTSRIGSPLKEIDLDNLANFVSSTYKDINCKTNFKRQISEYAVAHTFHPIKQYFNNLPTWDGVSRAEKIFVDYLGIDDSAYSREVTLNFFIAALARIYYPGCEYQYMPIFQGEQGIGKGKIVKMLVDAVYKSAYVEMTTKLNDSHAVDILRLAWFVEMPELSSMKKVSVEAIKSFVSKRADTNRFAYDKDTTTVDRHCVFFGSVNEKFPLKDKTGNRRFLILKSNLKENQYVEGLTDDYITQFWAEVFFKFQELCKGGFNEKKLLLSKESIITAAELAKSCLADDGLTGDVLAALDAHITHFPVWRLMSEIERRQFFENGGSITLTEQNLLGRQNARRRPDEMKELKKVLALADINDYSVVRNEDFSITFYGAELRDSICAAEIFNEHFRTYDRRIVPRIAEILATELPKLGWIKKPHKDKIYRYQPNSYFRNCEENIQAEEVEQTVQEPVDSVENVTATNDNSQSQAENLDAIQPECVTDSTEMYEENSNDVADDVTIVSSQNFDSDDEEEFLTDEDFEELHQITRDLRS